MFFPLSDLDYRNYKPQLNNLHKILTGENLFSGSDVLEDSSWLSVNENNRIKFPKIKIKMGELSFNDGGYFTYRDSDTFVFIRCGKHKDRPAHADNLHFDLWVKGENVLRDSGTYKYNTDKKIADYFTGSNSHNTVSLNGKSQMLKGSRFIWYYWSQAKNTRWEVSSDRITFIGKISAFRFVRRNIEHQRSISIIKNTKKWIVEDEVFNADDLIGNQNWHLHTKSNRLQFTAHDSNGISIPLSKIKSFNSSYYGVKEDGNGLSFSFKRKIETIINFE